MLAGRGGWLLPDSSLEVCRNANGHTAMRGLAMRPLKQSHATEHEIDSLAGGGRGADGENRDAES